MKILVIGGGGREHAMVWKLKQSAAAEKIWCAPGNDGIANDVECVALQVKDANGVAAAADLAQKLGANLTVVGPELPLVLGIADEFAARGLALLGPGREAAQLEGSKIFSKKFMQRHGIPTPKVYGIHDSSKVAYAALESVNWPLVIKADGLCAGKGVLVTSSAAEAREFIARVMENGEFGDAGKRVLFEEGVAGEELSYIILTDGRDFIRMAPARDHKRAYDNDVGPNTGGMGVYSIDEILPRALETTVIDRIVRPTLDGLRKDGMAYRGFLYFGLMLTAQGPQVLEYNCRLGDPETEAVLLRADFDFAEACARAARGELAGFNAEWSAGASLCVVVASKGYPANPQLGTSILGLEGASEMPDTVVFHAGTRREGATFRTSGGRVLVVSAKGDDLAAARRAAYSAVERIEIEGSFYRRDIGKRGAGNSQQIGVVRESAAGARRGL